MGKGGGGCQTVGYGYTLTMLYAFCERADKVTGWKVNDKIWWKDDDLLVGDETYSTFKKSLYTGKKGDVYHSDGSDHTDVTFYLKDYDPISYPKNTIGYDIKLNNVVFAYMPNAFVGDNTTTVPRYNARLSRFVINGKNHRVGKGSINPIAVIREILEDFLQIKQIDDDSFKKAYDTCQQEGLGVSFIMTTEKKVKDWIQEILRVIDGVMWFDTLTGKWKIKLFRQDTDNSNIFEISEANTSSLEITSGSWDNLVNEFTFKYTNILTGKTESFTLENSALFNIIGYKIGKTFTYQLVGEYEIMAKIANRVIKKGSKPLSKLKARISILDLPYIELGDVVKVSSHKLKIDDKYFRITKIGGDKEDDVYIDIDGIEDVWEMEYNGSVVNNPITPIDTQIYDIANTKPFITKIIELPEIFVNELKSMKQPISSIVTYPANYNSKYVISGVNKVYTYEETNFRTTKPYVYYFGKLGDVFNNTNYAVNEYKSVIIKPFDDNTYCEIPVVTLTQEEWQQNKWLMLIGSEIFSIKSINPIEGQPYTYKVTGIIRLNDKQFWSNYDKDTPVFLLNIKNSKNLADLVDFNLDAFNANINLSARCYNYATKSQPNTDSIQIEGNAIHLLNPTYNYVYKVDGKLYLMFSRMARGLNTHATLENIEEITAGEKEGTGEETHIRIIYNDNDDLTIELKPANLTYDKNGLITINISKFSQDITYENIKQIQTICINTPIELRSDLVNVIKK